MTELVEVLEGVVGAAHLRADGEARAYAVDGVVPRVAAFPGSVEEVSAVLQRIKDLEARHVTLVLADSPVRQEVQLVKYNHPDPIPDPHVGDLNKLGYNHVCFVVDNIEAEVERLKAGGVELRNEIMDFHSRKLIYFYGPEGVTLELAQWL